MDITSVSAWVVWLVMGVFSIGVGMLVFFLKRLIADVDTGNADLKKAIEDNKKDTDTKIAALDVKLNDFIKEAPFVYTLRDDFIRTINNVNVKLDKIYDKITEKKAGGDQNG